jgi:primosomal protein N' (replication factor Y)
VWRARQANIPILLGSATPSLESLHNAYQGRYQHFTLPERAGSALHPSFQLIDMRQQPRHSPFSPPLHAAMQAHIAAGQQVLIFFNRRGYAPTFMCYHCGWIALCSQCDAHLIYHDGIKTLRCHHCGAAQALPPHCPACQVADLHPVGHGTERLTEQLQALLPEARIVRIDSDTTRPRNAMTELLDQVQQGDVDVLLGTQILAKGHHFPNVTLVGVINTDGGLFSVDFRAPERMAQLVIQVAGRAGRVAAPGLVLVQTYHPEHPLLQRLLREGYPAFAQAALQEREQAQLPPYAHLALLRADAPELTAALKFLQQIKALALNLPTAERVSLWGPVAAPMTKRGGRYRAQLLLQANQRPPLHQFLQQWLPQFPKSYTVRWSLDVDPQDLM